MSQLDGGTGTGPAPEPRQEPVQAPAAATTEDDYIRVPRSSIPEQFGGDWHAAMAAAKAATELGPWQDVVAAARNAGLDPDTAAYMFNTWAGGGTPYGISPPPAGLNRQDMETFFRQTVMPELQRQIRDLVSGALTEHTQRLREDWQRQEAIRQSAQRTTEAVRNAIKEWGYDPQAEGAAGRLARMVENEILDELFTIIDEQLPEDLPQEQRDEALMHPTDEQIKEAIERVSELRNIKFDMAAQVAQEQSKAPDATLGEGPAGREPKPSEWEQMTPEQQFDMWNRATPDIPEE